MGKTAMDQRWVFHGETDPETGSGIEKRVMAYSKDAMVVENRFEKGAVGALHHHPHTQITYVAKGKFEFTIGDEKKTVSEGDTLLKTDGVEHGCVCLEEGILVDFFTPYREDFV